MKNPRLEITNESPKDKVKLQVYYTDNTNEPSKEVLPNGGKEPHDMKGKKIKHILVGNDTKKKMFDEKNGNYKYAVDAISVVAVEMAVLNDEE